MTTVASTTIKPIENKNNNQNTVKKNKEKKQIGVGGAVALGTSLAALASVGTYILMRGKCKKLANSAIKLEESLNKYINDLNIKLQRAIDEKENLKRTIRSNEDIIENLRNTYSETSDKLLARLKELDKLKRELKNKDEEIKILKNKI